MAQLIIPAAGAAAGWWVGGSTGASIGWAIGSMLSTEDQEITMPSIGDLRVQTSQAGVMIPYVAGTQRLAGNIIWAADKVARQVTQRSGGKGGFVSSPATETVVTTYSISMAIAICRGPILGIRRVWEDGTLKAEAGSGQTKLPGTLYNGTQTTPDPTIVSAEGAAPSYNGIAYMVFEDFDLGASGRVPQFSFEVVREGGL